MVQTKKKLHLANLTRTQTHQNGRDIQFKTQNGTYKDKCKRDKKALHLSKLTLLGI